MTAEELFPAPAAENHWTGDPWWNLQLGAYQFGLLIERMAVPSSRAIALSQLRRGLTQAQDGLTEPSDAEQSRRVRQTLAPYVETDWLVVTAMLEIANITKDDVVYDLGCGDGRIVYQAARQFGCRSVGIERDRELFELAVRRNRPIAFVAGFSERLTFIHARVEDKWAAIQLDATVVFVYWTSVTMRRWLPEFRKLKPGTRIVSNAFDFGDAWPPTKIVTGPPEQPYRVLRWDV